MVRKSNRVTVDRTTYLNYRAVADNFFLGAEVAREYEYWNAAGVLIIHAAIALADAICIKFGGVKSRGENHYETISLLEEFIAPGEQKAKALNHFRKIIDHKNLVSYSGEIYERKDVAQLWKWLERFRSWAFDVLK